MPLPDHIAYPESPASPPASEATLRLALTAALGSVALGVLSIVLLCSVAGIPAVVLGFLSLRWLNVIAEGGGSPTPRAAWARRLAVAGMAMGGAGIVLAVVGLVSLILVRVGEAGRRTTCANNLRQVGLAVAGYHEVNRSFPSATVAVPGGLGGFALWQRLPYEERLSWYADLLPYLGREAENRGRAATRLDALYEKLDRNQPWHAPGNAPALDTVLPVLLCPSHSDFDRDRRPAPAHHVGIAGVGRKAAELPPWAEQAGFFGYGWRRRIEEVARGEGLPAGLSNTMMVAETEWRNGPWAAGGFPTVRPVDPAQRPHVGRGRPFGGMHPGGANLLMVGGEVRFFSEQGSAQVFEALAAVGRLPED